MIPLEDAMSAMATFEASCPRTFPEPAAGRAAAMELAELAAAGKPLHDLELEDVRAGIRELACRPRDSRARYVLPDLLRAASKACEARRARSAPRQIPALTDAPGRGRAFARLIQATASVGGPRGEALDEQIAAVARGEFGEFAPPRSRTPSATVQLPAPLEPAPEPGPPPATCLEGSPRPTIRRAVSNLCEQAGRRTSTPQQAGAMLRRAGIGGSR